MDLSLLSSKDVYDIKELILTTGIQLSGIVALWGMTSYVNGLLETRDTELEINVFGVKCKRSARHFYFHLASTVTMFSGGYMIYTLEKLKRCKLY